MNLSQGKLTPMQASFGSVAVLLAIASAFAMPMLFGIASIVVAVLALMQGETVHGALALVLSLYMGVVMGGMMPMM